MVYSSVHAQPPLEFIPPAFNPVVLRVTQLLLPTWVRSQTAITHIQADHVARLAELYHQFQAGKIRFLIAFRHPHAHDPFAIAHLLWYILPRVARQQQISLQHPIHAHFIYDRGIPLWAGAHMGWLYSRLGGTPIHRGKVDRIGLRSARDLFVNGKFPIVAAPEGATNGHNEIISPLEPGIAQLGFWCVEDLLKSGRAEQVSIVPIGIQYRYVDPPWEALEKLLGELEADNGLPHQEQADKLSPAAIYQRLYRLGAHLLTLMEEFYTRFYHQTPIASKKLPKSHQEFTTRLQALLDIALQVAEQYFDLQPKGSLIDRCRRLEQAGWDYIYREDINNIEALSPLEKGLADLIAEEANLRMWHMRLVESFVAVTGAYVVEKPTLERLAETTLLMWDAITRIKGDNPFHRPRLGKQSVQMTVGEPISVSQRWEVYHASRRSAKGAIADLTHDLQIALERIIA